MKTAVMRTLLVATAVHGHSQLVERDAAALTTGAPSADPGFWYSGEGSDSYYEARNRCKWSDPISAHAFWGDSFLYTDTNTFTQFWHDAGRDNLLVRECHAPDVDREGHIWVIRSVGPFNTTGGAKEGEWHAMKFHEPVRKRWVTGRFSGRVDADGTLFPSPPLHVHHEHFAYQETLPSYVRASWEILGTYTVSRMFALHGDNYFKDADGGVIGNAFKSYPEGYGKRMENVYYHDNRIGDIRPPQSPVLQWWSEIAYRYTLETPKRELLHMSRFNMANFFENVHIHVPEDTGSIFWLAWEMPADGEFESNWCHTHGAEHIIIFKGDPKKFALGQKYAKNDPWTPKPVDNVDDVASELIESATAAGIGHCEGNIQWEGEEIRMTQINCKPWQFKEGEVAAIVALYDPTRRPYTNLRQHFIFRGDWFPDDPSIVDRRPDLKFENTKFCGENPAHCLSHADMGIKVFMVVVNFGWMPEYYAWKSFVGWCILLTFLTAISLACIGMCKWVLRKLSNVTEDDPSRWELPKYVAVPSADAFNRRYG